MRVRRHQDDPSSAAWAEIDRLRVETRADAAQRDRLVLVIAAKNARMTELMALITEDADADTIQEVIAAPLKLEPPSVTEPKPGPSGVTVVTIDGKTRKEKALRALLHFGRPVHVREVIALLNDDYTPVYNALNDLRFPDKNGGIALVVRENKLWSLTDAGRKEAERLLATKPA